ncbi:pseudouridine synthase [Jannaschia ovalis]|uniref:Pseudouridine synthase n=1 Tax=Jannaschia ovalis TaxID=3038773 RepID=A0ABY8LEH9_9RHOB|nr:pseudouridine synthase [Jannaschia sp. GRR-S6-38]WGH79701.1 pseudouridine synthase [Jannaschia sp. GRR-S6-38]
MSESEGRDGDRIAKVIARAGLASRRDAEGMVADLRVKVNGRTVSNVAHNVLPGDRVTIDGKPLPRPEGARLWLYHKPEGLVTTERDEKGRQTVFDALPDELGRVLSVGRLDLNSEGLLLLTNDGELKRQLELPATGWLRRYRVRVNGTPDEAVLDRLRAGIEVEGEQFGAMQVTLDRQQGANAWLTVGLREGRNREIRRAMSAVDLHVNRLIRVSYGPFQLGNLAPGAVEEVRPRVLKDQLGGIFAGELAEGRKELPMDDETPAGKGQRKDRRAGQGGEGETRGRKPRPAGDRLVDKGHGKPGADRPRAGGKPGGPRRDAKPGADRADRAARPDRPRTGKPPVTRNDGPALGRDGERPERGRGGKPGGKPFRKAGDRPDRGPRRDAPGTDRPERAAFRKDGSRPTRGGPGSGGKPGGGARPAQPEKETKAERTTRLRQDSAISLRKGGQRGRGIAKPKKPASTKRMKKPDAPEE